MRLGLAKQVKPCTGIHVNELVLNQKMNRTITTIPFPQNIVDYATLVEQLPMGVSLLGEILESQMINTQGVHEWMGVGLVKNLLPPTPQSII